MVGYFMVVQKDEDSAYGAYFPDLPGCYSAGDTQDEVIENGRISLRLYVEDLIQRGTGLPAPRSLEQLMTDAEVRQDVSNGNSFLMWVPLLFADTKRRVNVTLEPSLIAAIDEAARIAGISRSEYLATAARREIEATTGAIVVNAANPHKKVA